MGTAIDTSIPMIETTIRISISVNPRRALLPLGIRCSIASLFKAVGIHVEHILPAPRRRLRIVLHAALSPVPRVSHWIERNPPQEFHLLIHLVRRVYQQRSEEHTSELQSHLNLL